MAKANEQAKSLENAFHRIDAAHQQNYEALERAPIWRWGELNQLRPLTDLRHALASPQASVGKRSLPAESAAERFNAIYATYVELLGLPPNGNLRVVPDGDDAVIPAAVWNWIHPAR